MSAASGPGVKVRAEEFTEFLIDCVKNTPSVDRVQTLAEAGDTQHPYGIAVQIGGRQVHWQVTSQLAPGERHGAPAAELEGEPAAWADTDAGDGGEEWLAAVIGRAGSPRVARLDRWSTRNEDRVGVTVFFHNGARVFVRFLGSSRGAR